MFKNLFFSRRLNIAALFLAAFLFNLQSSVGQTSTQNFGTTTGSHTSGTGSSSFIPNPTSGTTYARAEQLRLMHLLIWKTHPTL